MSTKKIEIFENTLLKLLVRRGTDSDRRNVILSEGELGYATDTKRLFVGDSQTIGGVVAGNVFKGVVSDMSQVADAVYGDLAYDSDDSTLYVNTSSNTWLPISRNFITVPGNDTINITGNTISVGTISSANLSNDVVGNSITLDSLNRISLNGTQISTNSIVPRIGSYLSLPQGLNINNVIYNWPVGGTGEGLYLRTDIAGNLTWTTASAPNTFFVSNTSNQIPVGTIIPFSSNSGAPYGWLLCNGQEVTGSVYPELSAVIGESFGSSTPGVTFKVPNYINSTLYGVSNTPSSSTTFNIASGGNTSLSAQGSLFIIKAISEPLIQSAITINDGLTSTVNSTSQTGNAVSPLSGNIEIGLPLFYDTPQRVNGGTSFDIDEYGRVTTVNLSGEEAPAGEITTLIPKNTQVVNETSPIVFFKSPVSICSAITTATITAFPFITTNTGLDTNISVAPDAKNIILESHVFLGNGKKSFVYASLNQSLASSGTEPGLNEFSIFRVTSINKDDDHSSFSQTFIPLSAAPNGSLGFVMRMAGGVLPSVRAIGYTR
jgi:microcystin-dependent protein